MKPTAQIRIVKTLQQYPKGFEGTYQDLAKRAGLSWPSARDACIRLERKNILKISRRYQFKSMYHKFFILDFSEAEKFLKNFA